MVKNFFPLYNVKVQFLDDTAWSEASLHQFVPDLSTKTER